MFALFVVAVSAVLLLGHVTIFRLTRQKFTIPLLFAIGWLPSLTVFFTTTNDTISGQLYRYVLVSAVMICIGSFTASVATRRLWQRRPGNVAIIDNLDIERLRRLHIILVVLYSGYTIYQFTRALPALEQFGGLSAVLNTSGYAGAGGYKSALVLQNGINGQASLDGASLTSGIISYLLYLGFASIFTGAVLWKRRMNRWLSILPLLLSAVISLSTLQRTSFILSLLMFILACILLPANRSTAKRRRPLILALVIGIMGIIVIVVPLSLRNEGTRNSTGLASIEQYYVGGIAGLNARLNVDPDWSDRTGSPSTIIGSNPGYGAYTFFSFFSIARRAGIPLPDAPHDLDYYYPTIDGQTYPTNVATLLSVYRLDFGEIGTYIAVLILGFISTTFASQSRQRNNIALMPFASMLAVVVLYSFFVGVILGDFRNLIVAVVAGRIFVRCMRRPEIALTRNTPHQAAQIPLKTSRNVR